MPGLLGVSPLLVLFGEFFVPYLSPSGRGVEIFSSKGICYIYRNDPRNFLYNFDFFRSETFLPPPYPPKGGKRGGG